MSEEQAEEAADLHLPQSRDTVSVQRPFSGRPIFVIVGMHRTGASILAQMLQLLGVSMSDLPAAGEVAQDPWERPGIAGFNDRLLAMLGHPLGSVTHALPFPAGWWSSGEVQMLKREVRAYLRAALTDNPDHWGFRDLRVARLLPFWQQIFDELGLKPVYLWTVRDPADCVASAVGAGLAVSSEIAEAMWFVYNAEIQKYVGGEAGLVIDYDSWVHDPGNVVRDLLERLPLQWRGSDADLLECVGSVVPSRQTRHNRTRVRSPLVQPFYEAIRDPQQNEKSLRYRASIIQAMDILRTLLAPYVPMIRTVSRNGPQPEVQPAQAAQAEPLPQSPADAIEAAVREVETSLGQEIESRIHENNWLKQKFEAQIADLQREYSEQARKLAQAEARQIALAAERDSSEMAQKRALQQIAALESRQNSAQKNLESLRKELTLQQTANEKYLARIYELKATIKMQDSASVTAQAS